VECPHPGDGHTIRPHFEAVAIGEEDAVDNYLDLGIVNAVLRVVRNNIAIVKIEKEGLFNLCLLGGGGGYLGDLGGRSFGCGLLHLGWHFFFVDIVVVLGFVVLDLSHNLILVIIICGRGVFCQGDRMK